jgi:hypothetical protein
MIYSGTVDIPQKWHYRLPISKGLKMTSPRIAATMVGLGLVLPLLLAQANSAAIVITNLPAFGARGGLSGYVTNANPTTNCLAVFIYVAGDWYSQPSCAHPSTPIQPDGSWSMAALNASATEIAAFLVPTNYAAPCVNGIPGLTIPPEAEAVVYANRVNASARHLNFSDYSWWVKTSGGGLSGPGPNYYSDTTNNVWVDAQGFLHLQISYTSNEWQCVEIISDRSFGYGQYRFTVSTPVNSLDPNVVLGLFTWSNDTAYNDREIDIELSRWAYSFGSNDVGDYAVAPYAVGQVLRFPLPEGVTNATHSFRWQSNNIAFQSLNGNFASPAAVTNVLESWTCGVGSPPAGGEQVHMNLWLDKGNAPASNQPVEVIISKFEFVPLGSPKPAQLNQLTILPGGEISLSAEGVTDWHYQIMSSSNLLDWLDIGTALATNTYFQFTETNTGALNPGFYRVLTEP